MVQNEANSIISGIILRSPVLQNGILRKGVVVCNYPWIVKRHIPDLDRLYWIVERRGWQGFTGSRAADIQLVDDLPAQWRWNKLAVLARAVRRWTPWPDSARLPIALPYGNADFVDTSAFMPDGRHKIYDALMIARWDRFKNHQLLVDAFRILKRQGAEVRGLMFGHMVNNDTRSAIEYKNHIVTTIRAEGLPIDLPGVDDMTDKGFIHTKNSIAQWINASRAGLVLARVEAINRFKMESLSCDVPVIICDDACWCVRKHIGSQTGIMAARRADAVAAAILAVRDGARFSPRGYIMAHTGIDRAMAALQHAVDGLDAPMGLEPAAIARYDGRNDTLIWDGFVRQLSVEVDLHRGFINTGGSFHSWPPPADRYEL